MEEQPIQVAVQSQALVCSSSTAGIAGSNPAEGMEFRSLCLLCVVQIVVFATSCLLVQRNLIRCVCVCVCVCVI